MSQAGPRRARPPRSHQTRPSPGSDQVALAVPDEETAPLTLDIGTAVTGQPVTAQEFAYDVLRRSIMHGALTPGTRLTQSQLASQLSLSTTPIREALRRLASEGFVRIDAYRGAIVRGLDKSELIEIYELRILLEPLAARKAVARITDAELDAAEALWQRMNNHTDINAWVEDNREFHAIFARAAHSPNLMPILKQLRDSAAPYVRLSIVLQADVPNHANQEHRAMLDAFRARDGERAAALQEEHLRATLAAVLDERNWPGN
jgi:DNA-binding GntR family transcriptional regulator